MGCGPFIRNRIRCGLSAENVELHGIGKLHNLCFCCLCGLNCLPGGGPEGGSEIRCLLERSLVGLSGLSGRTELLRRCQVGAIKRLFSCGSGTRGRVRVLARGEGRLQGGSGEGGYSGLGRIGRSVSRVNGQLGRLHGRVLLVSSVSRHSGRVRRGLRRTRVSRRGGLQGRRGCHRWLEQHHQADYGAIA